jgi:FHA domain-containing protein/uncharacterized protein DUF1707
MTGNPRYRWRGDRRRVSDADRDRVINSLWARYDEGWLCYDTFAGRLEAAVHTTSRADLEAVLADLPGRGLAHALPAALRSQWQRGWAALAGRLPRVWQAAAWPVLMFPAGEQSRFTIGRDSGCDMVLPDPTVSRWHAGLRREPGGWLLDDLGSTNGTLLNGWRVRAWVPVRDGDLVSFGAVTFVVGTPGSGRKLPQTP